MNTVEEAQEFFEKVKGLPLKECWKAAKQLSEEVQSAYHEIAKNSYFVPENACVECRYEKESPSGAYRIVVTPFHTSPGYGNHSQGLVYRKGSDEPIAEVRRNYGQFPFLFVEGHPKGDFLVCGEDYQGQTVVELSTGRRRSFLPEEAKEGFGFCWAGYRYEPSAQILVVDGCYWACPYEYRFYDFSDPMEGWPQIEPEEGVDRDDHWPTFEPDGTIRCYQTESSDDDDDEAKRGIAATRTFRREGLKLVQVSEEVTEKEQERRRKNKEASEAYEKWLADFKANDPLYVLCKKTVEEDPAFSPEDHIGIDVTHKGWCPDFDKQERRMCRRIVDQRSKEGKEQGSPGTTIDIEWGMETGPIKLVLYREGKHVEDKFFGHSVEAMQEALVYAKGFVTGGAP